VLGNFHIPILFPLSIPTTLQYQILSQQQQQSITSDATTTGRSSTAGLNRLVGNSLMEHSAFDGGLPLLQATNADSGDLAKSIYNYRHFFYYHQAAATMVLHNCCSLNF